MQKEGTPKGQEYEEEDVRSYGMYLRGKDDTGTELTKNEAINSPLWNTRFGIGCGRVARQTM